jgi:hypothetical protein
MTSAMREGGSPSGAPAPEDDSAHRPEPAPERGSRSARRVVVTAISLFAVLLAVMLVSLDLTAGPRGGDDAAEVTDDLAEVTEDPAEATDDAAEATDEPVEVSDEPAEVTDILWRADYDTVTTDEDVVGWDRVWHREQEPEVDGERQEDRIRVVPADDVPSPSDDYAPEGNALRVEIRPYDDGDGDVTDTGGYRASRSEVLGRQPSTTSAPPEHWPDPPGSTRWYDFSIHLDEDWEFGEDGEEWLLVTQWKGRDAGSPAVALELEEDEWVLGGTGGRTTLGEAVPGEWVNFQVGLHFSPDPDEGWAEVWMNGEEVLSRTDRATLNTEDGDADPAYLKQGIYRDGSWSETHVAHFGPLTIGMDRESAEQS